MTNHFVGKLLSNDENMHEASAITCIFQNNLQHFVSIWLDLSMRWPSQVYVKDALPCWWSWEVPARVYFAHFPAETVCTLAELSGRSWRGAARGGRPAAGESWWSCCGQHVAHLTERLTVRAVQLYGVTKVLQTLLFMFFLSWSSVTRVSCSFFSC